MGYYDYRSYFETIQRQLTVLTTAQDTIVTILSVICFMFIVFFLYYFIKHAIGR